ncbi:Holliday junction resolvase RuvX [Candidatus Providencia siddallii]|uniref:Putative pre-16S rRNA nuclease n=1 Tax=Candidatus Providencia siddallii TaxID=1715285 RepID=A0ABM9NNL2_9GAMM
MLLKTLLAFDYGTKSIGVAVGQSITKTGNALPSLKFNNKLRCWEKIEFLIKEWQPQTIIVGIPYNMDGTEQKMTNLSRKFANKIYTFFGVKVDLHDERLTTIEAKSILFEQNGYRALNKGRIDSISAVLILESWFIKNN